MNRVPGVYRWSVGDIIVTAIADGYGMLPLALVLEAQPETATAWARAALDADGARATATRLRMLDMAAADRMSVSGMHRVFLAIGHVARNDKDTYGFLPTGWQRDL